MEGILDAVRGKLLERYEEEGRTAEESMGLANYQVEKVLGVIMLVLLSQY